MPCPVVEVDAPKKAATGAPASLPSTSRPSSAGTPRAGSRQVGEGVARNLLERVAERRAEARAEHDPARGTRSVSRSNHGGSPGGKVVAGPGEAAAAHRSDTSSRAALSRTMASIGDGSTRSPGRRSTREVAHDGERAECARAGPCRAHTSSVTAPASPAISREIGKRTDTSGCSRRRAGDHEGAVSLSRRPSRRPRRGRAPARTRPTRALLPFSFICAFQRPPPRRRPHRHPRSPLAGPRRRRAPWRRCAPLEPRREGCRSGSITETASCTSSASLGKSPTRSRVPSRANAR